MLNQRLKAAREINDHLVATERAIDIAVTEAANLAACMPRVRMEANIAAEVGHEALERSAAAFSALIEARREIVAAHRQLAAARDQIGLNPTAVGGAGSKGPSAQTLTVVEAAA